MRRYGRKKDHPDTRDLLLAMPAQTAQSLPRRADVLEGTALPVYDQGELGSCTANAGVLYRRWLYQRFSPTPQADQDLSRLFLYWQERALPWNDATGRDSGAETRDICVVLSQTGVCPETDYPYTQKFTDKPTAKAAEDAAMHKIGAYHRIPDLGTLKACLAGPVGYPVLVGFPVFESFESIGSDGLMPMPAPDEQEIGGHEVFCHGYDDDKAGGVLCFQNSWGESWGDRGHFYIPYAFATQNWEQFDAWMMHLGKPWV